MREWRAGSPPPHRQTRRQPLAMMPVPPVPPSPDAPSGKGPPEPAAAEATRPTASRPAPSRPASSRSGRELPVWLFVIVAIGAVLAFVIATSAIYAGVFRLVSRGIAITLFVTAVAFVMASALGLGLAVMLTARSAVPRQIARTYVEVVRGVPILVLLFYVAFVGAPALVMLINWAASPLTGGEEWLRTRDISLLWRAVIALTIGYSAFIAEVFRAGLQSVDRGQVEAAMALGLTRWQRFRRIVAPQAIRTVLPPLGNDFVAMVKDSSLVSVLGVADVTQLGKIYASSSFRFFETYSIVAYIYLVLTISLSLGVRAIEKRLRREPRG